MSVPLLTPLDSPIFDEDVIAGLDEHFDEVPRCEAPKGCDKPATHRLVIVCPCRRWSRCGCTVHVATSLGYLATMSPRCGLCHATVVDFWTVPL
ncbi:MAG: hypothetical protein J0I43_01825 [Microbacterium sp.]|uniref:hypothetical protein n=1 Tax=Microbacterium sp. TaxID=51671 RepID=UPI001ACFB1E6|nr:hypothetical protein [Microbacterium sp.]MBN9176097.1 hypothetical protein [Microbacterium sp.]